MRRTPKGFINIISLFPQPSSGRYVVEIIFPLCYINEPKMAAVYWSLGCLFLHCRLKSISLKVHQHQTQTFTHPIISKVASKTIFLVI